MTPTIEQSAKFSASPAVLFEMYMDSAKHSAATGAPARISRLETEAFGRPAAPPY